nr:glycosyltransferase [uncultured Butyrivibrio sp.]
MIKVCHVTCVHLPYDVRIFEKECISLSKAGYETHLVQQGESGERNDVIIHGYGKPQIGRVRRMLIDAKRAYNTALSIDADIYHFHDPEFMYYGYKLKKKGKIVIFDSHENTAELIKEKQYLPKFLRPIISFLYRNYERIICNKLDAIVYPSDEWTNTAKQLNKNYELISNYPIVKDVPSKDKVKGQIAFAGTITERWCHEAILSAIKDIEGINYVLCGRIPDEYMTRLEKNEGWKKVTYNGQVSHDEVYDILATSTIGVAILEPGHNTNWERGTLGCLKIFEEMMMEIPIICTNFVLWKEFVEEFHCGICVQCNNIEQIKKAIIYLLNNPDEALLMGKNGRKAVEERFNWKNEEKKLLNLYMRILHQ